MIVRCLGVFFLSVALLFNVIWGAVEYFSLDNFGWLEPATTLTLLISSLFLIPLERYYEAKRMRNDSFNAVVAELSSLSLELAKTSQSNPNIMTLTHVSVDAVSALKGGLFSQRYRTERDTALAIKLAETIRVAGLYNQRVSLLQIARLLGHREDINVIIDTAAKELGEAAKACLSLLEGRQGAERPASLT